MFPNDDIQLAVAFRWFSLLTIVEAIAFLQAPAEILDLSPKARQPGTGTKDKAFSSGAEILTPDISGDFLQEKRAVKSA